MVPAGLDALIADVTAMFAVQLFKISYKTMYIKWFGVA